MSSKYPIIIIIIFILRRMQHGAHIERIMAIFLIESFDLPVRFLSTPTSRSPTLTLRTFFGDFRTRSSSSSVAVVVVSCVLFLSVEVEPADFSGSHDWVVTAAAQWGRPVGSITEAQLSMRIGLKLYNNNDYGSRGRVLGLPRGVPKLWFSS